jgi:hypothetical protein
MPSIDLNQLADLHTGSKVEATMVEAEALDIVRVERATVMNHFTVPVIRISPYSLFYESSESGVASVLTDYLCSAAIAPALGLPRNQKRPSQRPGICRGCSAFFHANHGVCDAGNVAASSPGVKQVPSAPAGPAGNLDYFRFF